MYEYEKKAGFEEKTCLFTDYRRIDCRPVILNNRTVHVIIKRAEGITQWANKFRDRISFR